MQRAARQALSLSRVLSTVAREAAQQSQGGACSSSACTSQVRTSASRADWVDQNPISCSSVCVQPGVCDRVQATPRSASIGVCERLRLSGSPSLQSFIVQEPSPAEEHLYTCAGAISAFYGQLFCSQVRSCARDEVRFHRVDMRFACYGCAAKRSVTCAQQTDLHR